jgi:hypothetical protein
VNRIGWLNVELGTDNFGDKVISNSIRRNIVPIAGGESFREIPTHKIPSIADNLFMCRAHTLVVGGSNILSSHLEKHRQWPLPPWQLVSMRKRLALVGVGWWQYQGSPCAYTRRAYETLLISDFTHSVRDSYSQDHLAGMGFDVVNTGCPTTWQLPDFLDFSYEAQGALVTITDYYQDLERDRSWIRLVKKRYGDVALVPMGKGDRAYLGDWCVTEGVKLYEDGLVGMDRALAEGRDFIGTRLHAGIYALQHGRRALILGVDNRTAEMGRDLNLAWIPREEIAIGGMPLLTEEFPRRLTIPREDIDIWLKDWKGRVAQIRAMA